MAALELQVGPAPEDDQRVAGPDAPTWLVEWWPFETWTPKGDALRLEVERRYVEHGTGCDGRTIWLLRGVDRSTPLPRCHGG